METAERENDNQDSSRVVNSGYVKVESADDEDYVTPLTSSEISDFMSEMRKKYSSLVVERIMETSEHDQDTGGRNVVVIDGMEDAMIGTVNIPLDKSSLKRDSNGLYVGGMSESEMPDTVCVAVYEEELCISALARKYMKSGDYATEDKAYEAARENFDYNTMGYYPNWKQRAPLIIHGFGVDRDRWEAFLDE